MISWPDPSLGKLPFAQMVKRSPLDRCWSRIAFSTSKVAWTKILFIFLALYFSTRKGELSLSDQIGVKSRFFLMVLIRFFHTSSILKLIIFIKGE